MINKEKRKMYNLNGNVLANLSQKLRYCSKCGERLLGCYVGFLGSSYHLCPSCDHKYRKIRKNTPNVSLEDFIKEVDFKVGDQVITSDGRIGAIVDICTCDMCKERGFDEPKVRYSNGDTDYITISNKNNGFKYFYQIGNKVFGNLDEETLVSRIETLKTEMQELENQLNTVQTLKNN